MIIIRWAGHKRILQNYQNEERLITLSLSFQKIRLLNVLITAQGKEHSGDQKMISSGPHHHLREDYRIGPMSDEECYVAEVGWGRRRF